MLNDEIARANAVDPNRLCSDSDPDPASQVRSDPEQNRIRISLDNYFEKKMFSFIFYIYAIFETQVLSKLIFK